MLCRRVYCRGCIEEDGGLVHVAVGTLLTVEARAHRHSSRVAWAVSCTTLSLVNVGWEKGIYNSTVHHVIVKHSGYGRVQHKVTRSGRPSPCLTRP